MRFLSFSLCFIILWIFTEPKAQKDWLVCLLGAGFVALVFCALQRLYFVLFK